MLKERSRVTQLTIYPAQLQERSLIVSATTTAEQNRILKISMELWRSALQSDKIRRLYLIPFR